MSAAPESRRVDLARVTLGVLLIGGLLFTTFWIVRPFLGPLIWATMLVVASWPLMQRAQRLLWGRRALAVLVMMAALPVGTNALIFAQRYDTLQAQATTAIVFSTLVFAATATLWLGVLAWLGRHGG